MADKPIHIAALSFHDAETARAAFNQLYWLTEHGHIKIEGSAFISKAADGTVTVDESKASDAGPTRGGVIGGFAGFVLAVATGPIGVGAIVAGAAVGAVAAHMYDAGFKDDHLRSIGDLMRPGRTVLLVGVLPEYTERLQNAIGEFAEFQNLAYRWEVDVTDQKALGEAVAEFRRTVVDAAG